MCKQYVNANVICFGTIISENDAPLAFCNPFDTFHPSKSRNGYELPGFQVMSYINILGTADKEKQSSHILYQENKSLDFILRLTKCDEDPNKRFYYDLDAFQINIKELRENHKVDGACFDFINYARTTNVPSFKVERSGSYVIKLLVKESTDSQYAVQFIKRMQVEN